MTLAEKIEQLPSPLRLLAEGYIDGLVDVVKKKQREFVDAFERAEIASENGDSLSDAEFKARLDSEFGTTEI